MLSSEKIGMIPNLQILTVIKITKFVDGTEKPFTLPDSDPLRLLKRTAFS
jgi:hypothetical protein